jgi:hypothetical protein
MKVMAGKDVERFKNPHGMGTGMKKAWISL